MKRIIFKLFLCAMLITILSSCELFESESDCGEQRVYLYDAYGSYFTNPSDIYWGVTSGVRSYTYNFTCASMCTKQNPKVDFTMGLRNSNSGSANPISVNAGVYTCLGVQPHHVVMTPDAAQLFYRCESAEIGMNQCFSGQASATIYPYMTVSFNTLGSDHDDSLYLVNNVIMMRAYVDYNIPK